MDPLKLLLLASLEQEYEGYSSLNPPSNEARHLEEVRSLPEEKFDEEEASCSASGKRDRHVIQAGDAGAKKDPTTGIKKRGRDSSEVKNAPEGPTFLGKGPKKVRDKNKKNSKRFRDRKKDEMDALFEEKYRLGKEALELKDEENKLLKMMEEANAQNVELRQKAAASLLYNAGIHPLYLAQPSHPFIGSTSTSTADVARGSGIHDILTQPRLCDYLSRSKDPTSAALCSTDQTPFTPHPPLKALQHPTLCLPPPSNSLPTKTIFVTCFRP